jgi:hypothetical protein
MKIRRHKNGKTTASVLLIVLAIAIVLGIGLASYLSLVQAQKISTARSHAWNAALAAAEAGVEEALAQLNPSALLLNTNIDRGANGWSLVGGLYQCPIRTLSNGWYAVSISSDAMPAIYATGYVAVPTFSAPIVRTLVVRTRITSLFGGTMAAKVNVDFKGNMVETDGFDSLDPNYSTNGFYDPMKRKASGDIATTAGVINVQNANIMGTMYTGPQGSYSVGANGSVGDVPWVQGGNNGVQPGHYKNDLNIDFPEVLAPYSTGVAPAGKTIGGTNYTWALGNSDYYYDQKATFKTGDIILVTGSQARLYVTSDFLMQGSSSIVIAPGASLELYVGGANSTITSINNAGNCSTFKYYGLPGNTSFGLTGNDAFLGTVYAPNATFTLGGGGNNTIDYQGACAVSLIKINGHFKFHFDENLRRKGPVRGFTLSGWSEL